MQTKDFLIEKIGQSEKGKTGTTCSDERKSSFGKNETNVGTKKGLLIKTVVLCVVQFGLYLNNNNTITK